MRHLMKQPKVIVLTVFLSVLALIIACGGTADTPVKTEKEPVKKEAVKKEVVEKVAKEAAPTAAPEATTEPAVQTQDGPSGVFNYGYRGLPPFNVFPTITEGAAYHHNGFTTAETLVFMNKKQEIVPRLFKE